MLRRDRVKPAFCAAHMTRGSCRPLPTAGPMDAESTQTNDLRGDMLTSSLKTASANTDLQVDAHVTTGVGFIAFKGAPLY